MPDLISARDLQFMLYEVLDTEALLARPRYAEHSREVFDATLDTARQIAEGALAMCQHHYLPGRNRPPGSDPVYPIPFFIPFLLYWRHLP